MSCSAFALIVNGIYEADVSGYTGRRCPRKYADLIGEVLLQLHKLVQPVTMTDTFMSMRQKEFVNKDPSRWCSRVTTYAHVKNK